MLVFVSPRLRCGHYTTHRFTAKYKADPPQGARIQLDQAFWLRMSQHLKLDGNFSVSQGVAQVRVEKEVISATIEVPNK